MTVSTVIQRGGPWLSDNLFPDAPAPSRITTRRALVIAALAVAAVAVQLARMWPSAPLNSIWAEDGYTWLADAMHRGFFDALTTPYNGYLQTLPRLVAEPVALLPVRWFAAVMAISGATIVTGCAYVVWLASAGHIEHRYVRAALAATVVLLPVVDVETLDNVTNSIWFFLFAGFWLLLWRPATFPGAAAVAGVLFLCAVSNVGVVLLLPLWLLRLCAIRDRRDAVIVAAFAVGVLVQLGVSWNDLNTLDEAARKRTAPLAHWDWNLVPAYVQRVVGGALSGAIITGYLWRQLGTPFEFALGVSLLALVILALAGTNARIRVLVPLTVAISLATFLISGYERWIPHGFRFLWPHGAYNRVESHYMVVPTLLLSSVLFMWLDVRPSLVSATAWTRLRAGAVLFVLFAALVSFNAGDSAIRGSPTWSGALNSGRSACLDKHVATVKVAVAPFLFPIETGWVVPIACSKLS